MYVIVTKGNKQINVPFTGPLDYEYHIIPPHILYSMLNLLKNTTVTYLVNFVIKLMSYYKTK